MATPDRYQGDIGQVFTLQLTGESSDISAATGTFYARKPSGIVDTWTVTFDNTASPKTASHTFVATDLDEEGRYEITLEYVVGGVTKHVAHTSAGAPISILVGATVSP